MKVPKVINEDVIERIADYAQRGYSKSATGRELNLDRTTVRKYWPKQGEGSEEKEGEEAKRKLSIEEEYQLLNKKQEIDHDLESLLNKIQQREWETEDLKAREQIAVVNIDFLMEKLDEAGSVAEADRVCALVNEVKDKVALLLAEDEPLLRQREEQEEKERREREEIERKKREDDMARWDRIEQYLRQATLSRFAWMFPCTREQAEKIVNKFISKVDISSDVDLIISSLRLVSSQLRIAEELKWGDDADNLGPLITECVNLLKGNSEEKQRIVIIMHARKERILIPSDEIMRRKFIDLLSAETNGKFVTMVLKFNAGLSRLVDERFIDKEELVADEMAPPKVKVARSAR